MKEKEGKEGDKRGQRNGDGMDRYKRARNV